MPSKSSRRNIIQSLWIGQELSKMEQLSVSSFLHNGHPFHLFVYDEPRNVPRGTILKDAAKILPRSKIFLYKDHPSVAGFADSFRYKLLFEHGHWWVDLDVVCLKPFRFDGDHVFASEHLSTTDMTEVVTNGVIRAPAGSEAMRRAYEGCRRRDPATLKWGETGPILLHSIVRELGLTAQVHPAKTFCPMPYYLFFDVITPGRPWEFNRKTFAIHLWNEMWRRNKFDKDGAYSRSCLYEELKGRYLSCLR
jgi:mannosyltransferase OCH1-like enzyme